MKIQVRNNVFIRTNDLKSNRHSIWFLHGFGDSGLAYKEVFNSPINQDFNIYIVDLPGFGASPINPNFRSIKAHANLLVKIIEEETQSLQKVNIVAHSIGALIGTWVCQHLKYSLNYYFNIEGNLTEADSYFSSKPLQFETSNDFIKSFQEEIFDIAKIEERYKRYYSSLRFADAVGMRNWSISSQEHIKNNQCGIEFKKLACHKLYIWGDLDTPDETQKFIVENNIPNKLYKGIGHWHMVENASVLYEDIYQTLQNS